VLIHWQGGQHTELELRKRRPGEHRYALPPETVTLIGAGLTPEASFMQG
jgi:hypothetical protein